MKKIVCILRVCILIIIILLCNTNTIFADGEIDIDTLLTLQQTAQERMEAAHIMAEQARFLGYDENHYVIVLAGQEWNIANDKYQFYQTKIDALLQKQREVEFPTAYYVWNYLINNGLNEYAAAGIIGNFMIEVGGHTLNLDWSNNNSLYYGLAQWSKYYYPEMIGASLEKQCATIVTGLEYNINTYGNIYKKGFTYESFLELEDECAAALAFAMCYERCTSASYLSRAKCASIAYEYFSSAWSDKGD